LEVGGGLTSVVLHFILPLVAQKIEAEGIQFRIDFLEESLTKLHKVLRFDPALKYGALHPLAIVETCLGDPTQTVGT
jgi:hypothetical protein